MTHFSRPMFAVAVSLLTASFASAQGRIAIPAEAHLATDVAMGDVQRTVLYDDIAHYSWLVRVGPEEHDLIRLHRVVKEVSPNVPATAAQAVMFFPGAPTFFDSLYLPPTISDVPAPDRAIAIFLAKNGIDVWGMDYRWAVVPESTTDFRFMKKWGVSRDVEDGQIALTLARWIRGRWVTSSDRLFLSGLSYGASVSYGVAANDTQRPLKFKNVKGIIPLDSGVKYQKAAYKAEGCAYLDQVQQLSKSGTYNWDNRYLWDIGLLAISDPGGTSVFDPAFDNYTFGLVAGTYPNDPVIPWHFVGGFFDSNGIPTGLRFTGDRLLFDLFAHGEPPYSPVAIDIEDATVQCDHPHVGPTYADHLGDITVPIFYVGAAGGFGHFGDYTTTLTASTDITILIVQTLSADQRSEDYGHADLVVAASAEPVAWQPILDWIRAHQ